ncbi:hypothetical protein [Moorena sp. SIO3A2]|uniref:hypothetical protein n=1 Tax=Moorena sp. SIO3A2 TaxID=2607841 RepID=UPI0013BBBB94|nr:hypothetical protein [Moorena sp. SIO3A2]NER91198.1 hypothetical protein [Moorena sp. SIO3A2]
MTWWVERASWWNGHLGGTGILVERASWWNGHLGGTGILVERASWWNGHLARFIPSRAVPTLATGKMRASPSYHAPYTTFTKVRYTRSQSGTAIPINHYQKPGTI